MAVGHRGWSCNSCRGWWVLLAQWHGRERGCFELYSGSVWKRIQFIVNFIVLIILPTRDHLVLLYSTFIFITHSVTPKPAILGVLLSDCLTPDDFTRQWRTPRSQWVDNFRGTCKNKGAEGHLFYIKKCWLPVQYADTVINFVLHLCLMATLIGSQNFHVNWSCLDFKGFGWSAFWKLKLTENCILYIHFL